ncbi:hypothetical protein [Actinobacillus equuli]|uniref:hypothetical protein n=1 Tax=Actinobacillus equuli TaxID=718 RepID=UPI0024435D1F|nr:hypothetical protein [Actinobacillus equuli]WGE75583.1 hypothetical protein NYR81_00850 [Actinobacillus equuli subsp. haemolyticus]WGE77482.1 hypothetical protein NYR82_00845 [Actinobacillus equuli subsp. haemolyticus]
MKNTLRDQQLGVYSLRFDSTLNPETQRVESELSFVANPDLTDKLVEQARLVLSDLANQITEEDVQQAKAMFVQAEKGRLNEPRTWLSRLILSDEQFGNPQYLSDMQQLTDEISVEKVKAMAGKIYNPNSEKLFVTTPKK